MSRPENADVRNHRLVYPNRKPLLISAILVALTSVPTLVVVAAGTISLDRNPRPGSSVMAAPSNGPVIIEPDPRAGIGGKSTGEPPRMAKRSLTRDVPRTDERPTEPAAEPVVAPRRTRKPTRMERRGPSPSPAPSHSTAPPPQQVWTDSDDDGPDPGDSGSTGDEPRIDDQAWPGWDRHLDGDGPG